MHSDDVSSLTVFKEKMAAREKERAPVRDLFYKLTKDFEAKTGERAFAGLIHVFSEFVVWRTNAKDPSDITVEMISEGFTDHLEKSLFCQDQGVSADAFSVALKHFFEYVGSVGYENDPVNDYLK